MHRLVSSRWLAAVALATSAVSLRAQQDTTSVIRYKAVTLTPVFAAVGDVLWRSRNLESDIGSPYQNIPFNNTTNAKTTEFRGTGRHSRMGFFAEAPSARDTITAMWEVDFLTSGTTSKSDENNGYGVRLRQGWVFYNMPEHFSIGAGQMWSLLTTNKKGIVPRTEQVPTTVDAQYAVGYDWARQAGLRLTKSGKVVSAAVSIEGAQTTFSARNVPSDVVLGQPGGSALNVLQNYSTDVSPDFIGKIAFDPAGWGHWELKALGRVLRDRIVDPANVDGGSRSLTSMGGGVGFGVYYPVMSKDRDVLDIAFSGLGGKGIGRYGTSQLVDATVKSDGSLEPIKAAHVVLGLEAHPTRKLDVYTYEGVEYNDRTAFVDRTGRGVGYGSPLNNNVGCEVEGTPTGPYGPTSGTCNADNRSIMQANLGFWYRIRKSAVGTLQWGMQVSHTVRQTWAGVGGEPVGQENMFFSSFRYLLP
ncbi:MAG TPA: hypothetical protein VGM82_19430 [Gemmatimonadaceae bacterium]|jgi:hypothetical protein